MVHGEATRQNVGFYDHLLASFPYLGPAQPLTRINHTAGPAGRASHEGPRAPQLLCGL